MNRLVKTALVLLGSIAAMAVGIVLIASVGWILLHLSKIVITVLLFSLVFVSIYGWLSKPIQ